MDISTAHAELLRLSASLEAELQRAAMASVPARRVLAELVREEIGSSCRLAGAPLERDELDALIDRGLATGDRPLRTYLIATGYAQAAGRIAGMQRPRPGKPFLELGELVDLHATATRLQPELEPGTFRRRTLPAFRSGVVPPPFWLVPREAAAFVERFAGGPPADIPAPLWVAQALERFDRIRPFAGGNGRAGRLVGNLLLRRLGLPPLILRPRESGRFLRALTQADAADPWPLAALVARALLAGAQRLAGALDDPPGELIPLADLAAGRERAALYKAIQRGRLRVTRRGNALFSTHAWLAEYRSSRPRA